MHPYSAASPPPEKPEQTREERSAVCTDLIARHHPVAVHRKDQHPNNPEKPFVGHIEEFNVRADTVTVHNGRGRATFKGDENWFEPYRPPLNQK
mgnify:CR=1 FL=1